MSKGRKEGQPGQENRLVAASPFRFVLLPGFRSVRGEERNYRSQQSQLPLTGGHILL